MAKQNLVKMANPDLPQEILLEIFSKLPTKSVGRCRTLSRSWKIQLSTKSFIKKHLISRKQTIQQEKLALFTQGPRVVFYDKRFPGECFNVFGSCNGLISTNTSITNGREKTILMNPITLKRVTIQHQLTPQTNDLSYSASTMCGFGYDSCSDDYKIVQLLSFSKNGDGLFTTVVDVYSLKNGVWKRLHDGCYPYGGFVPKRYAFEGGAFVNGALHWLICSEEGYRSCITAFDLANEFFSEIPLPKEFVRQLGYEADFLVRLRRTNGVSVAGEFLLIFDNFGNGATDVWVMREYGVVESWVKFRIQSDDVIYEWDTILATLCYVEDGELLCVTSWGCQFACDLKGGTTREVVLGGCDAWVAHGMAFVDSLVSPEGSW